MKSSAQAFTQLIKEVLLKKHTPDKNIPVHSPTKAELKKKWPLERVKPE